MELADAFDKPVNNQSALSTLFISLNVVQGNVTLATNAAGDIRRPLMGLSMTEFLTVSLGFIIYLFIYSFAVKKKIILFIF